MRTRALSNKLSRLEARFPLRFTKRNDELYPLTLEERCSGRLGSRLPSGRQSH